MDAYPKVCILPDGQGWIKAEILRHLVEPAPFGDTDLGSVNAMNRGGSLRGSEEPNDDLIPGTPTARIRQGQFLTTSVYSRRRDWPPP